MKTYPYTIADLEAELNLKAALGREYFSKESQELKTKLRELKAAKILKNEH